MKISFLKIVLFILIIFSTKLYAIDNDTIKVEAKSIAEADESIANYIKEQMPIVSDEIISDITSKRMIEKVENPELQDESFFKVAYPVGKNYLKDTMKILWELNIPEFRSHIFQIYDKDTIFIDTWNNVVGTASNKTYTGDFEGYRVRNYPSWKDPSKGAENKPASPPGPNNPLGLFVVHYDENSLRYFHGTNKNNLIYSKMRNLSHGCVRNDNDNIDKMKEFLIKRVIKSKDLSFWLESKKSMIYDFAQSDRFPVRIIYKTFTIDRDNNGMYVELYKDVYNYSNSSNIDTKWNDAKYIILTTKENLASEFSKKNKKDFDETQIDNLVNYVMKNLDTYERYYIKNLSF